MRAVPVISKVISSKWHHVKGASPPTISHGGWCSSPVFKRTVDKQRMGETTDQHAGSQSNGRQSRNNLRHAWAPLLKAPPEIWQLRGQTSPLKVCRPRSSCKKYLSRRLYVDLVQRNHGNSGGQISLLAKELGIFWYHGKDMAQRNS